jgi:GT2 family glycosyltransferase
MPISVTTEDDSNRRSADRQRAASQAAVLLLLLLIPLDWLVLLILLGGELLGGIWRRIAPQTPPAFSPPRSECSFVLLNWNSQAMLAECLPPLLEGLRKEGGNHEVIVVDNHSTDGTDEFIRRRFPEVRLVLSDENLYFGAGNRLGITSATRDILVLMNSDTIVQPGFLRPLLKVLSEPTVFGVASQVLNSEETGNTHARFNGFEIEWRQESLSSATGNSESPVFWLHRGLFAVDRRKYLWLGGLDSLYDPMYLEDVDLSYRAWKTGWKCLVAVDSRVLHNHEMKIPAAGEGFVHMIVRRNLYLFVWKNITSISMLTRAVVCATGTRLRRASLPEIGTWREMHSFFAALKRLPGVMMRRVGLARRIARSDEEVFELTAVHESQAQMQRISSRPDCEQA